MYHHTNENMKIRTPINLIVFSLDQEKINLHLGKKEREREVGREEERERKTEFRMGIKHAQFPITKNSRLTRQQK